MFYRWRARRSGSPDWRELGWCMTEEDARTWAEENGHQIEPLPCPDQERFDACGALL
jgi:hypothetical protein